MIFLVTKKEMCFVCLYIKNVCFCDCVCVHVLICVCVYVCFCVFIKEVCNVNPKKILVNFLTCKGKHSIILEGYKIFSLFILIRMLIGSIETIAIID